MVLDAAVVLKRAINCSGLKKSEVMIVFEDSGEGTCGP
jgi:hypothetical protein